MKKIKLNNRGFSHELLIVLVVVISAIIGVGLMVGSHADSITKKKIMSGPNSIKIGSCSIKNVADYPKHGKLIKPSLVVYNSGKASFMPKVEINQTVFNDNGNSTAGKYKTISLKKLKSNQMINAKMYEYRVGYRSATKTKVVWTAYSYNPSFSCQATANLPYVPTNGGTAAPTTKH